MQPGPARNLTSLMRGHTTSTCAHETPQSGVTPLKRSSSTSWHWPRTEGSPKPTPALRRRCTSGFSPESTPTTAPPRCGFQRAATRAVATDPDLPQAQLAQGLAAASLVDALTSLRRAIDLDPSFAEGYDQIGRQIIELDPVLALQFFEKALELDPLRDLSWMNRVSAHAVLDRFEEAEAAISRGREHWPDQTGWNAELARIEFEQHRYEAGLQLAQEGTMFEVSPMSSVVYADALYMSGQRAEALGLATRTAARVPSFCEGRATVAALRFAADDRIAARSLANDIFEEADRPNAARSAARCAALVAAGISDPTRAAEWLRRIATDEAALRAWIRHVNGSVAGWRCAGGGFRGAT